MCPDCQPPPARYTAALLEQAVRQAAATVRCDTTTLIAREIHRAEPSHLRNTLPDPVIDPALRRTLQFGTHSSGCGAAATISGSSLLAGSWPSIPARPALP
jgi:hypothetical protein